MSSVLERVCTMTRPPSGQSISLCWISPGVSPSTQIPSSNPMVASHRRAACASSYPIPGQRLWSARVVMLPMLPSPTPVVVLDECEVVLDAPPRRRQACEVTPLSRQVRLRRAYPHSAATSASRRRGSRAASTERSNRVIRTAALGVMPSSPRNRCSRCRVDHPTSDATPATGVRPPPHRISRQARATSGGPAHRDSCRRISSRTTRSTAANRSGHVAYPSSSSRRDRATRPTTSSSPTEVSTCSALAPGQARRTG